MVPEQDNCSIAASNFRVRGSCRKGMTNTSRLCAALWPNAWLTWLVTIQLVMSLLLVIRDCSTQIMEDI